MRVIVGPRGSGRTTELIRIAHETDQYIVEPTERAKRAAFRMALDMGMPIRNPLTPHELLRSPLNKSMYGRFHSPSGVLIDDAEAVLSTILRTGNICAVALTSHTATLLTGDKGDLS